MVPSRHEQSSYADSSEIDLVNFIGYPTVGKDTQVAQVKALLDKNGRAYKVVGTGDALRKEKDAGTSLGREAAVYMDKGKLVPSSIINPAVQSLVSGYHADVVTRQKLWMINGYPRAKDQVEEYLELVREFGRKDVSFVLSLGSPEKAISIMLERATKRARGPDDEPEAVKERYEEAREELDPVVERLRKEGLVMDIDADAPEHIVTQDIRLRMESIGVL